MRIFTIITYLNLVGRNFFIRFYFNYFKNEKNVFIKISPKSLLNDNPFQLRIQILDMLYAQSVKKNFDNYILDKGMERDSTIKNNHDYTVGTDKKNIIKKKQR